MYLFDPVSQQYHNSRQERVESLVLLNAIYKGRLEKEMANAQRA